MKNCCKRSKTEFKEVTIMEYWEKCEGIVHYVWKRAGTEIWFREETGHAEIPIVEVNLLSKS